MGEEGDRQLHMKHYYKPFADEELWSYDPRPKARDYIALISLFALIAIGLLVGHRYVLAWINSL